MFSTSAADGQAPQGDSSSDEEEEDKRAAKRLKADAEKEAKSEGAAALEEGDDARVRTGNEIVKSLRKKTKNTLFCASAIMAIDNLQTLTRLIFCLCNPVYNAHSENARSVRAPGATVAWYLAKAKRGSP